MEESKDPSLLKENLEILNFNDIFKLRILTLNIW